MKFSITENEMCDLTGYTRRHLQNMRLGGKQVQHGVLYRSKPLLKKGKDCEKYGWVILYCRHVPAMLQARKNKLINDTPPRGVSVSVTNNLKKGTHDTREAKSCNRS